MVKAQSPFCGVHIPNQQQADRQLDRDVKSVESLPAQGKMPPRQAPTNASMRCRPSASCGVVCSHDWKLSEVACLHGQGRSPAGGRLQPVVQPLQEADGGLDVRRRVCAETCCQVCQRGVIGLLVCRARAAQTPLKELTLHTQARFRQIVHARASRPLNQVVVMSLPVQRLTVASGWRPHMLCGSSS